MKWMLFVFFFAVSVAVKAQTKGDNTILLPANLSAETMKSILFQNGYSTEGTDNFLSTSSKQPNKTAVSVKFMIMKSDTAIILKGLFKSVISLSFGGTKIDEDYETIQFRGSKSSLYMEAWNEMNRIARSISQNIKYTKQ